MTNNCIYLSNRELISRVKDAAANERGATARLIALVAEFDERRLYLGEGCSSLFTSSRKRNTRERSDRAGGRGVPV